MVAGDHRRRRGPRNLLAQHDVGGRDGKLADGDGEDHVTKINKPAEPQPRWVAVIHQEIVVVGIVVDDAVVEFAQPRHHQPLEPRQVPGHQLSPGAVFDELQAVGQLGGPTQVPRNSPPGAGVVEAHQGQVEPGEPTPDFLEQRRGVVQEVGQG